MAEAKVPETVSELVAPHIFEDGTKKEAAAATGEFFEESSAAVAVDISGSTAGAVLEWSKSICKRLVGPRRDTLLRERTVGWDTRVERAALAALRSRGGTDPACLFAREDALPRGTANLLITTDGEIPSVDETRARIRRSGVVNVVAVLVAARRNAFPARLQLSVFFPFLEHAELRGGAFLLLHYAGAEDRLSLLMKRCTSADGRVAEALSRLPEPPAEYADATPWSAVPAVAPALVAALVAPRGAPPPRPGALCVPPPLLPAPVDARRLAAAVARGGPPLWTSAGLDAFVRDVVPAALDAPAFDGKQLAPHLREIVHCWRRGMAERAERSLAEAAAVAEPMLREFETLSARRHSSEDRARLAELSRMLLPELQKRDSLRTRTLQPIQQLHASLMQRLAAAEAGQGEDTTTATPANFSLAAISKMGNRAKRAATVVVAPEDEGDWDTSKAALCPECCICARGDQPAALLMVDLAAEGGELAEQVEQNISDAGMNDPIGSGARSSSALPAGDLCMGCAYACAALGKHPLTRQKVASVIVCADPAVKRNRSLIEHAVCASLYAGRSLPGAIQSLLGAVEAARVAERFPPEIVRFLEDAALLHSSANLLPIDTCGARFAGTSKPLLQAMRDVVSIAPVRADRDTWLVPLRNRSLGTTTVIASAVLEHAANESERAKLIGPCVGLVRRCFVKAVAGSLLSSGKRDPAFLERFARLVESDLYDTTVTGVPVFASEHLCAASTSHALRELFGASALGHILSDHARIAALAHFESRNVVTREMLAHLLLGLARQVPNESALNVRIEDLLAELVSKPSPLADAFFTGESPSLTHEETIRVVAAAAPYAGVNSAAGTSHERWARFAACHMFSPPVSRCSLCGLRFATDTELAKLREVISSGAEETQCKRAREELAKKVHERRNKHFVDVYKTEPQCPYPTRTSALCSMHRAVREVASRPEFAEFHAPTRQMVEAVVEWLRSRDPGRRGCIYDRSLLEDITAVLHDFISKRNAGAHVPAAGAAPLSVGERLALEACAEPPLPDGPDFATLEGLSSEVAESLTAPFA